MIKSVDCKNISKISLRDAVVLKNDNLKTLKERRVFVISIADV
jgi:hypothetical protein